MTKMIRVFFVGIYCKCLSQLFICDQPVVLERACGVGVRKMVVDFLTLCFLQCLSLASLIETNAVFMNLKKKSESVIFNQTLSFLPCVFLSSLTLMDILFPIGPFTPQEVPCNTVYL